MKRKSLRCILKVKGTGEKCFIKVKGHGVWTRRYFRGSDLKAVILTDDQIQIIAIPVRINTELDGNPCS